MARSWIAWATVWLALSGSSIIAEPTGPVVDLPEAEKQTTLAWHKDVDTYLVQQRLKFSAYFRKAIADAGSQPLENRVTIAYTANHDGVVTSASVPRTSGYPPLDEAALHFIQASSPVPAAPAGVRANEEHFVVEGPFRVKNRSGQP